MTTYQSDVFIKFDLIMDPGGYARVKDYLKSNQEVEVRYVEDDENSTFMLFLLGEKIGEVQLWNFEKLESLLIANTIELSQIDSVNKNDILVRFRIVKEITDSEIPKLDNGSGAGIYKILINEGHYVYVGQTGNINNRIKTHWTSLNAGDHHNARLQSCFLAYGSNNTKFEIVEIIKRDKKSSLAQQQKLEEREKYWIQYFKETGAIVLNNTTGEFVKTKKSNIEAIQNKKISNLAYDLGISVKKAKIKYDIEVLKSDLLRINQQMECEYRRLDPMKILLKNMQEKIKSNSGFFNRFFSSIPRIELDHLVNEERALRTHFDNESAHIRSLLEKNKVKKEQIQELNKLKNKCRSNRQMENDGLTYSRKKVDSEKYFDVKNCVFSFKCKKDWNELLSTIDNRIKFCSDCNKHVYRVDELGSYLENVKLGECIAVFTKDILRNSPDATLGLPKDGRSSQGTLFDALDNDPPF